MLKTTKQTLKIIFNTIDNIKNQKAQKRDVSPISFLIQDYPVPKINSIFPVCELVKTTTDSVFKGLYIFLFPTKKTLDYTKTQSKNRDKLEKDDQPTDT